jgi:glycosyltransferase involved in cell wall biosynthesis
LARIIQSYKPHVVHSRNWGALEAVPAARLAKVPAVVHSEHGYEIGGLAGLPRRQRIFRRVAYSMTDAVFTVTEDLRDYHARQAGVAVERIRVIANGVDTVRFAPHPEKRLRVRRDLGIPPDAFVAGSVGRLVKIKGHDTLLNAVQQRRATGSEAWVLLVGAGPELERLQQIANGPLLAGRVVFAGASDQVSDLLNAMDVFALPSLGEGFSNTLLEAMACGLPSLATCVGGNSEVMGREGLRWQFAPGDFEELAKHLEVLERDAGLRKAVGLFARERAVTRFNLDLMMNSYCNLYTSITERRGVRLRGEA